MGQRESQTANVLFFLNLKPPELSHAVRNECFEEGNEGESADRRRVKEESNCIKIPPLIDQVIAVGGDHLMVKVDWTDPV